MGAFHFAAAYTFVANVDSSCTAHWLEQNSECNIGDPASRRYCEEEEDTDSEIHEVRNIQGLLVVAGAHDQPDIQKVQGSSEAEVEAHTWSSAPKYDYSSDYRLPNSPSHCSHSQTQKNRNPIQA